MSLWTRLFRRERKEKEDAEASAPEPGAEQLIEFPSEPYVFECRTCGKVFENRRKKPLCPECDSSDVELVSR